MAHRDRISALLADVIPNVTDAEISGVLAAFDSGRSELEIEAPTLVKHPVCDEIKEVRAREALKAKGKSTPLPLPAPKPSDTIRPVTMDSIPDIEEVEEVTVAVKSSPELVAAPEAKVEAVKVEKTEKASVRAIAISSATPGAMVTPKAVDPAKATPTGAEIRAHMEKVRGDRGGASEVKRTKRSASWGLVAIAAALVLGVGTTGAGRSLAQQGKAWVGSLPLTTAIARTAPVSAPAAAAPVVTTTSDELAPEAPKVAAATATEPSAVAIEPAKVEATPVKVEAPAAKPRAKKR